MKRGIFQEFIFGWQFLPMRKAMEYNTFFPEGMPLASLPNFCISNLSLKSPCGSPRAQRFNETTVDAKGNGEMGIINIEQGTQNNEGIFDIRYCLFSIRYSKTVISRPHRLVILHKTWILSPPHSLPRSRLRVLLQCGG